MLDLTYADFTIKIFKDETYVPGSHDNANTYAQEFLVSNGEYYAPAKHGIRVFKKQEEISSCILVGEGSATGIHTNSAVLHNSRLAICCCDSIFCLGLPALNLIWRVQADWATCFQIFMIEDDYLVHGECDITRLTQAGEVKWKFSGADIFVSIEGERAFELLEDQIVLRDFTNAKYVIDFDGNLLES